MNHHPRTLKNTYTGTNASKSSESEINLTRICEFDCKGCASRRAVDGWGCEASAGPNGKYPAGIGGRTRGGDGGSSTRFGLPPPHLYPSLNMFLLPDRRRRLTLKHPSGDDSVQLDSKDPPTADKHSPSPMLLNRSVAGPAER